MTGAPLRFRKVLIANRGEIAVRIARTCRELGIPTVAVYSEADADAPHVFAAQDAVAIGPAEPARSYLSIERLIEAARRTGADAVHPGYGFLSESAAFARACRGAGLTFVGPPPDAIEAAGDKPRARALAAAAGVPIVPGLESRGPDDDALARVAVDMGYPVLLKAAAGGGGKGMRLVRRPEDFAGALGSGRREAAAAFGEGAMFVEKYVAGARHVEVQILGDAHGSVAALGERECSIQRRHQKIVEECPSPFVDAPLREALADAAVRVARACRYENAGTVEFLVDAERRFYFLEVNARLQVEHPVTESVMGLDLVAEQLRIAAGAPLAFDPDVARPRGWAIECRVYAEDPARDFTPTPGPVRYLEIPRHPGVRVDTGLRAGQRVTPHYDPLLAKVIAWAPDRPAAVRRMAEALRAVVILGIRTNVTHLRAIVEHPAFAAGDLSIDFLAERLPGWQHPAPPPDVREIARVLQASGLLAESGRDSTPDAASDPWRLLTGWRGP
jgi:acetyl-CoA carboxylase biotin carboxylase subunit